jgi:glycogen debranching enzyme
MRSHFSSSFVRVVFALTIAVPSAIYCQNAGQEFRSIPEFPLNDSGPVILAHAEAEKPFTVAGERGVVVGQQDGQFEAWVLPVKLLSHLTIEANIEGYTVPIEVNRQPAQIEVRPDRTVITYAHIGFTVRQIMFSPNDAAAGTGPVVLFEFDCPHPTDFVFRFNPELLWMWPERNEGAPGIEWVGGAENGRPTAGGAGGYYVIHSDYPGLAGAVTIAGAQPGILAPYQERPQVHPVELKVHYDPARDHGRLFPMLMAVGTDTATATSSALGAKLAALCDEVPALYRKHEESYKQLLASSVSIETPDKALNEAFEWAVISIEQLKAKSLPTNETALVAGYFTSGDSARPGFGWFFGRDALYTLFAVNGFGDFKLSKEELEFLIARQRDDGKIMHEYSQTAPFVDWKSFPYMYAAADATPLFLLAVLDYVRASGDTQFLTTHRGAIEKAWSFETDRAHDTDGDGIYDNSQGTGWVESWPGGMPHQEIYLALLDQQASAAMAQIEDLVKDTQKSMVARQRAEKIAKTIETEYYDQRKLCYAFNRNMDGSLDRTRTVYPALAWWSESGAYLDHGDECLRQLAGHTLNTDWGLRDLASDESIYDGMSYHQGSVWPLFTGWAALAEYRGGQPLAGYQMLMENANLTRAQDLGADTELLSGDFFVPFGRSTSHQLWSSAMVITPALRGLFGIKVDAQAKTITVNPQLPDYWNEAAIRHLQVEGGEFDLVFRRDAAGLRADLSPAAGALTGWHLRSDAVGAKPDKNDENNIVIPLPIVELGDPNNDAAEPGARTQRFRILSTQWGTNKISLAVEGIAGSVAVIDVRRHKLVKMKIDVADHLSNKADQDQPGVSLSAADTAFRDPNLPFAMTFYFPPGEGWKTMNVTLSW